jgi:uncharacterized membrane protein (DUF485 family)
MANASKPDWEALAARPAFAELLAAKRRFIVPATIFFLVYYMTLPVLIGYFPEMMKRPFIGKVNGAYAFAFSQFLMTFIVAWVYMRRARKWDAMEHELLSSIENR